MRMVEESEQQDVVTIKDIHEETHTNTNVFIEE